MPIRISDPPFRLTGFCHKNGVLPTLETLFLFGFPWISVGMCLIVVAWSLLDANMHEWPPVPLDCFIVVKWHIAYARDFVSFLISMKFCRNVLNNSDMFPLKCWYAWVTTSHAWLILVEKIAFSDKIFVIVWPISMKLEIWVDININLSLLKCWYAWVHTGGVCLS